MEGSKDALSPSKISRHWAGLSGVTTFCPHPQKHLWTAVLF
jgi:hypothetical protein